MRKSTPSLPDEPLLEPAPPRRRLRGLVLVRVVAILLAWVATFLAFLLAPLMVLAVAGAFGLALVLRPGLRDRGTEPAPTAAHRFGAGGSRDAGGVS
jgi:hypothetical protein